MPGADGQEFEMQIDTTQGFNQIPQIQGSMNFAPAEISRVNQSNFGQEPSEENESNLGDQLQSNVSENTTISKAADPKPRRSLS